MLAECCEAFLVSGTSLQPAAIKVISKLPHPNRFMLQV